MILFTVNPNTTTSEAQIQKNIQKLNFKLAGDKAAGVSAGAQMFADAGSTYVTLKRVSESLGEKSIWPRVLLSELLNMTMGIEGYARTTGTDAALTYTGEFAVEVSFHDNINVIGGDYLALTIENVTAGLTITVSAVSATTKAHDHLKVTKTALVANDAKRVPIDRADFVVIPIDVAEARLVGDDTVTMTANSLEKFLLERSTLAFNMSGGSTVAPTAACIPANHIDYIDFTNGATARNILIVRQTDY